MEHTLADAVIKVRASGADASAVVENLARTVGARCAGRSPGAAATKPCVCVRLCVCSTRAGVYVRVRSQKRLLCVSMHHRSTNGCERKQRRRAWTAFHVRDVGWWICIIKGSYVPASRATGVALLAGKAASIGTSVANASVCGVEGLVRSAVCASQRAGAAAFRAAPVASWCCVGRREEKEVCTIGCAQLELARRRLRVPVEMRRNRQILTRLTIHATES